MRYCGERYLPIAETGFPTMGRKEQRDLLLVVLFLTKKKKCWGIKNRAGSRQQFCETRNTGVRGKASRHGPQTDADRRDARFGDYARAGAVGRRTVGKVPGKGWREWWEWWEWWKAVRSAKRGRMPMRRLTGYIAARYRLVLVAAGHTSRGASLALGARCSTGRFSRSAADKDEDSPFFFRNTEKSLSRDRPEKKSPHRHTGDIPVLR